MRKLCAWMLYTMMGYTKNITEEHPRKYILCLAPHTSNWDFVIGQLYARAEGMRINFLMKKEWFFWPLGPIFRSWGGIPVFRQKNMSMTDSLANIARQENDFRLCITPEGTRSPNPDWKKGFYYISLKADIPILLYSLDYEKRLISCTRTFHPTGNIDSEMQQIKEYFRNAKGKYPENFKI